MLTGTVGSHADPNDIVRSRERLHGHLSGRHTLVAPYSTHLPLFPAAETVHACWQGELFAARQECRPSRWRWEKEVYHALSTAYHWMTYGIIWTCLVVLGILSWHWPRARALHLPPSPASKG